MLVVHFKHFFFYIIFEIVPCCIQNNTSIAKSPTAAPEYTIHLRSLQLHNLFTGKYTQESQIWGKIHLLHLVLFHRKEVWDNHAKNSQKIPAACASPADTPVILGPLLRAMESWKKSNSIRCKCVQDLNDWAIAWLKNVFDFKTLL